MQGIQPHLLISVGRRFNQRKRGRQEIPGSGPHGCTASLPECAGPSNSSGTLRNNGDVMWCSLASGLWFWGFSIVTSLLTHWLRLWMVLKIPRSESDQITCLVWHRAGLLGRAAMSGHMMAGGQLPDGCILVRCQLTLSQTWPGLRIMIERKVGYGEMRLREPCPA